MIIGAVLTDGRAELLELTLESLELAEGVDRWVIVNDSGDPDYGQWVKRQAPAYGHVVHGQRLGLAAAVQSVWDYALAADADFLFHVEGDFTIDRPIDVADLSALLNRRPHLAQVVLQRQPLSPEELAVDGVAAHAHWAECSDEWAHWVQQTDVFSLNPCLIPRNVLEFGWPAGPIGVGNEAGMTARLREEGFWFAFWGEKQSLPHVTHNGVYRAAGWML